MNRVPIAQCHYCRNIIMNSKEKTFPVMKKGSPAMTTDHICNICFNKAWEQAVPEEVEQKLFDRFKARNK